MNRNLKLFVSVLIVLQMAAVLGEPFRFFTRSSRGSSPAADPVRNSLGPYIEFGYLNHGYFFFAPEPGPSHLIDYDLEFADGKTATLRFPDRQAQWPRLLYHRHFMLTENLNQLWVPPVPDQFPPEADPQFIERWKSDRQLYETIRDSMLKHVLLRYGAQQVQLRRIEHRLPSDSEVFEQRLRLNDRSLYVELPDQAAPDDSPAPLLPDPGGESSGVLRQPQGQPNE